MGVQLSVQVRSLFSICAHLKLYCAPLNITLLSAASTPSCTPNSRQDPQDAWHMMKNMFDANALSLTFGGSVATMDQFTQALFMFCVGLDHHSDDAGKDHLISGLNTTGSLIPITFSANGSDGAWVVCLGECMQSLQAYCVRQHDQHVDDVRFLQLVQMCILSS